MGISILIVDDDRYLVEKLEETVQWERAGISMVFTAYNIRQAQRLIREFPIRLLLCDIDMPQGSGLELLEWIRSQKLRLECIFLSSYANFAYAQKALSLSTREYLLKPISSEELESAVTRVVQEYLERDELERKEEKEEDGGFWTTFFGAVAGHRELLKQALSEGRYRQDDACYLQMIRVWLDPREAGYRKELSLLDHRIRGLAHDFFEQEGQAPEEVVRVQEAGWMLVIKKRTCFEEFCAASVRWKCFLSDAIGQKVCIYIGRARPVTETERSWEVLEELEKRFLPGEDGIFAERSQEDGIVPGPKYAESSAGKTGTREQPEETTVPGDHAENRAGKTGTREQPEETTVPGDHAENSAGKTGTREQPEETGEPVRIKPDAGEEAEECGPLPWEIWQKSMDPAKELPAICDNICASLRKEYAAGLLTYERLERFLKELERFLYGYLGKNHLEFSELFDSAGFIRREKEAYISLGETIGFICWMFERLEGNSLNAGRQRDVVGQVKDYIEKHLGNELSRSLLAKEVWLSEDYVSKLFKSTTGMSLPTYIAARRMERAKEYLTHSALPVSRIAMEVGYSNFSYFSKTFRDATGMTPNEYRSQRENVKKTNRE